jgi:pimeloyl-ACP methyl ester carboxylesterase
MGALLAIALLACSAAAARAEQRPGRFAKKIQVAPHLRLWIDCTGSGPVALADAGLGIPTEAWADVRRAAPHVRLCAFDRAGVGRSDVRSCRCGSLQRDVEDIHALIRAARLRLPLILVGHSTGGLDSLLYVRRYPADVSGLVLVDSPSESAPSPPPPGTLADGETQLEFVSGVRALRHAGRLGSLPMVILSHGKRAFSTKAAERSWTTMQRQLGADSTNTLRVIASQSGHLIQVDQPSLVAAALDEAATYFPARRPLRCIAAFAARHGRCVS